MKCKPILFFSLSTAIILLFQIESFSIIPGPHSKQDCVKCHSRLEIPKICSSCHVNQEYTESVHGKALTEKGLTVTAVCIDCHNPHVNKLVKKGNIPKTCAKCHQGIYDTYIKSIHGREFLKGNLDVPVCTSCHGEHTIQSVEKKTSSVNPKNVPETCSKCHTNDKLLSKYSIPNARLSTYKKSYHGIALRFGKVQAAECASCHGYHDILPSRDPQSSINPKNIPKTCGTCHKGATENFAKGKIHIDPLGEKSGIIFVINMLYRVIIAGMIAGFSAMIILDLFGRFRRRKK